ncbi:alpha/beta hydrolase [Rhizobium sp. 16-449-1b]|uniref:alpha/beta fold hydrolase n=1 Tax=Rhizobium sp. 16-449-1b TaxID=2819989 RepID=UPI001ADB9D38|nr:alpha/beta hydrolase [Rhizobium sp. 16-449-1b]MBO9194748.1 alpha/beta hydrolase [Rhizobium sp. 16-449-1b]
MFKASSRLLALLALMLSVAVNHVFAASPSADEARIDVGGYRMNSLYLKTRRPDLPPIVFIHGASANLHDPVFSFRDLLEGRADLLFVDRPGHGRSDRGGPENAFPDGQADAIADVMTKRGIKKAIIVSHSFGGAVAASFALRHPDRVLGLVFLSPAVYPWPGGIAWYYDAAKVPVTGALFSAIVVPPVGLAMIDSATRSVFAPNPRPPGYIRETRALQALGPKAFRDNAIDVANLLEWTKRNSPRYGRIHAPTVIISGDTDSVVSPDIHARHLARAIKGARLLMIHNMGHKSDYVARDVAVAAIESVAGRPRDLKRAAARLEAEIAKDHEK